MAKKLTAILTDPTGKRIDQRSETTENTDLRFPINTLELELADGSYIEMTIPAVLPELRINWASADAEDAGRIQRRLIRQTENANDFTRHFKAMADAKAGAPAVLKITRHISNPNEETITGPFIIEPGKPWKLSVQLAKKPAAEVWIGANGISVRSKAFAPSNLGLAERYPGHLCVEVGPTFLQSELDIVTADDAATFRRDVLARMDAQGIPADALRIGGKLDGGVRLTNTGLPAAIAWAEAADCWKEMIDFESRHGRLCIDNGAAKRAARIDGKDLEMPASDKWCNGYCIWSIKPESESRSEVTAWTCFKVFRFAFEQGKSMEALDALLKFGAMDDFAKSDIEGVVHKIFSQVENEFIAGAIGKGAESKRESI